MSGQWLQILDCALGIIIGGGSFFAGSGQGGVRYGGGLVALFAFVLFWAILFGLVH